MVGIGQVDGGGGRWGSEFIDPEVSVYEGAYNPATDYDTLKPVKTLKLEGFGGVTPTPYPGGGTQVTRGFVQMKDFHYNQNAETYMLVGEALGKAMVELEKGS